VARDGVDKTRETTVHTLPEPRPCHDLEHHFLNYIRNVRFGHSQIVEDSPQGAFPEAVQLLKGGFVSVALV
jgi:hypothetical protein